jgi:hypothetical protein
MKLIPQTLLISCGLFVAANLSFAQSANIFVGVGTAMDSAANTSIDTFGNGVTYSTPSMGGAFPDIGASVLFSKHVGVGADVSWRASKGSYAGLLYRPTFYDFDGIWAPMSTKHFEPEVHAGLGGMHIGYSYSQTECDQFAGCSTSVEGVETSSHFQVHLALAARLYVTVHVFIRPAVDAHYVNNLFQFGSDWVPQYSIGVGYSFGRE